jgi:hypothetical protein
MAEHRGRREGTGRDRIPVWHRLLSVSFGALVILGATAQAADAPVTNPAPTAKDWADIAKLPDWSGIWTPVIPKAAPKNPSGTGQWVESEPAWTPEAARQIARLEADEKAGKPHNIYVNCLPEGMPDFIIMTLNALEILFTPGRVTLLGEFDGNRLRRIYTDGRPHPDDPDLTFNGHSIGHWDGDTLVVDTVGILPEVFLPLGQGVGLPNNGDLHIVEHIHLTGPDLLVDDLDITAPHVLTAPWHYTRSFTRHRERSADIVEASCRQGDFAEQKDGDGNALYVPLPHDAGGAPLPLER